MPGPAPPTDPPETLIEPASGWPAVGLGELWRYRELLTFLAWRDVKVRYKQTALGAAWAVLQPLVLTAVFWLFLHQLARLPAAGDRPYPLFVYAGLLPWFLFAGVVGGAANALLDSGRLITKVYFPRLVVPFAAAGPGLVDFAVASAVLGVLMAAAGRPPAATALLAPVAAGLILLAALGVGALLAALNVRYRDFRYVVPFLLQAWLFATPSVYLATGGAGELPDAVRVAMAVNPLTGLVAFFRAAVFGDPLPWAVVGPAAAGSVILFTAGCAYFRWAEDGLADVI